MALISGVGTLGFDIYRTVKANKQLKRMGSRPTLSVPKEVLAAYQERLKRSKMNQGLTQAELANTQRGIARSNASLMSGAQRMGGSAQAVQSLMGNNAAQAQANLGVQSAQMNRTGQRMDLNAADQFAGTIGGYQTQNERQAGINWDNQVSALGNQMQQGIGGIQNMLSTGFGLGMQGAMGANDTTLEEWAKANGYKKG